MMRQAGRSSAIERTDFLPIDTAATPSTWPFRPTRLQLATAE
jgi:hypothetical protein